MALAEQLPGLASVSFVRGDDWGVSLDLSIDATGYTWSAALRSVVNGQTLLSPTVVVTNAALGQISVGLTDLQTATLAPGTYSLRITGTSSGGSTRRITDGLVEVKA